MEEIRGELTDKEGWDIILGKNPQEAERIKAKLKRLAELGLSWKDL
ncbi:hypothetical protein V6667_06740 [Neisseria leonii]|uniref:Uncharacterized protein n=1 Tax=Neisseria leonii TaxID=2995413 RepID=A0A9X4IDX8_9NEIS|nr:hypothetical protein [Neisseria sp. 51.81]MDD9327642.1 hypothetical protein [Neisseria sp. 51.81]